MIKNVHHYSTVKCPNGEECAVSFGSVGNVDLTKMCSGNCTWTVMEARWIVQNSASNANVHGNVSCLWAKCDGTIVWQQSLWWWIWHILSNINDSTSPLHCFPQSFQVDIYCTVRKLTKISYVDYFPFFIVFCVTQNFAEYFSRETSNFLRVSIGLPWWCLSTNGQKPIS